MSQFSKKSVRCRKLQNGVNYGEAVTNPLISQVIGNNSKIPQVAVNYDEKQVLNPPIIRIQSEHERSAEFRNPSVIFFEKLVPAKANIEAGIWQNRTEIPPGRKENVLLILKNFNKDRTRYKNPHCDYGVWEGTTKTNSYRINGTSFEYVGQGDKDFGISESELVMLKTSRCYLVDDKNFKRLVTYVKKCPKEFEHARDFCTVEYTGTDLVGPNMKPHKNSKGTDPYKRINPEILEVGKLKIRAGLANPNIIRDVFQDLNDWRHPERSIPKLKTLSNLKSVLPKSQELRSGSLSDGLVQLTSNTVKIVNERHLTFDTFVQHTAFDAQKDPVVYCWKPWQLMDMSTNCKSKEGRIMSMMSIDTTFELDEVRCTMFSYQNMNLVDKQTKVHPSLPGPQMFHTKSDFQTFAHFFSHVKVQQSDAVGQQHYYIVTNEDPAIVKAVEHVYPESTHVLCCKHLKASNERKLKSADPRARSKVIHKMFDPVNGLIAASSKEDFKIKEAKIDWSLYEDTNYCLAMRDKIFNKVVEPRLNSNGALPVFTHTNISEFMEDAKKIENNDHPKKLPELIHSSENIVDSYQGRVMTSFYGQSQHDLVPSMSHVKKTYEQWAGMNEEKKLKDFDTFTRGQPEPSSTQTSFTIKRPSGMLEKPGIRSRATSEITRSAPRGRSRSQSPKTPNSKRVRLSVDPAFMLQRQGKDEEFDVYKGQWN